MPELWPKLLRVLWTLMMCIMYNINVTKDFFLQHTHSNFGHNSGMFQDYKILQLFLPHTEALFSHFRETIFSTMRVHMLRTETHIFNNSISLFLVGTVY